MKQWSSLIITLLLSLFLVACSTNQAELPQNKEEFQAEIQARLDKLKQEIEDLKVEAEQGNGKDFNAEDLNQTLQELEAQADDAARKLEELNAASTRAWKDFKPGLERALDELEKAYQKARTDFEEG